MTRYGSFDLTKFHSVTRGILTMKSLRPEMHDKPSFDRMPTSPVEIDQRIGDFRVTTKLSFGQIPLAPKVFGELSAPDGDFSNLAGGISCPSSSRIRSSLPSRA
jgi:hypothetical protein